MGTPLLSAASEGEGLGQPSGSEGPGQEAHLQGTLRTPLSAAPRNEIAVEAVWEA